MDPTLEALFRDQRSKLWGLAYRMTGSAEEADDLVQEAFLRLLAQPDGLRGHAGPWLVRVVTNLGIDAVRRRRRIRQHPVDGLLRYAAMAVVVVAFGPSPAAFAVYRVASALNALVEHANVRAPQWLDRTLSWVTSWPHMHKVHHSRVPAQTDSNYGNLFSAWDRVFGTYTRSWDGVNVRYGLEGFDDPALQTTKG